MTVAFGESTMSRTQVQFWYNHRFKEGLVDVNEDARPEHDENIKAVKKIILDNHRITIREVADNVNISFGSYQTIFTDVLGTKRAAAKIVTKLQNFE